MDETKNLHLSHLCYFEFSSEELLSKCFKLGSYYLTILWARTTILWARISDYVFFEHIPLILIVVVISTCCSEPKFSRLLRPANVSPRQGLLMVDGADESLFR